MNSKITQLVPAGLVLILLMITASGCGVNDPATPQNPPATLVSISITPGNPSIAPGTTQQFTATGNYSNGSHIVVTTSTAWTSSNTAVADFSNASGSKGLATATTSTGGTTITATYSGLTATTSLAASPVASLAVTPANPSSIAPGTTMQFAATGTLADGTVQTLTTWATWTSSDTAIATVSDAPGSKGLSRATSPGIGGTHNAMITADYSGISGTTTFTSSALSSIAILPASTSIAKGTTLQFAATGTLADGNTQTLTTVATWSTSSTSVATISDAPGSKGRATAVNVGTATMLSSFAGVTSSPATLTVTPAILTSLTMTPTNPSIALGKTKQFTATGRFSDNSVQDMTSSVAWNSSNTAIAFFNNTAGRMGIAVATYTDGTTFITATMSGITSNAAVLTVQ